MFEVLDKIMVKNKRIKLNKKLAIYQAKNGEIRFRGDFENETIWATQKQIAEVFGVNVPAINKHIKNILKEKELSDSTISILEIVQHEGKRQITRKVEHYNLDMMISVGCRVNSKKATGFRIWATKVLKQHIVRGYTINKKTVANNYQQFIKAVDDIKKLLPANNLVKTENILELVKSFSGAWLSLESYDEDKFPTKGATKKKIKIQAEELYQAIAEFKKELIKKKQATELFAQEKRLKSLEGILGNVMQAVYGNEVYQTVEEKAIHLLYFVVKNHPFVDGNKRTGAFAFIWFLSKAGVRFRHKITPEALTAITLLVAESKPKDKDRIIGLLLLLLKK